jgi:hypothetical protein
MKNEECSTRDVASLVPFFGNPSISRRAAASVRARRRAPSPGLGGGTAQPRGMRVEA